MWAMTMGTEYKLETEHGTITAANEQAARDFAARMEQSRQRHERMIARWTSNNVEQMRRLCIGFPSLRDAPGTDPFDAETLLDWALGPVSTSGSWHAVLFCLQVWNSTTDWCAAAKTWGLLKKNAKRFAPFNFVRAFQTWDDEHRAAFMAYAELPFNP